jgi:hypothetical protein
MTSSCAFRKAAVPCLNLPSALELAQLGLEIGLRGVELGLPGVVQRLVTAGAGQQHHLLGDVHPQRLALGALGELDPAHRLLAGVDQALVHRAGRPQRDAPGHHQQGDQYADAGEELLANRPSAKHRRSPSIRS